MLGRLDEKELVRILNTKNNIELWNKLSLNPKYHWAIHVNKKQKSILHNKKIYPKADVFIANGYVLDDILIKNEYILNEDDLIKFNLNPVRFSGISVKKEKSKSYTITKINPTPFKKIFGNYELGCGISVFVDKQEDIELNESKIFNGWNTNLDNMILFYSKYIPQINRLKLEIDIEEKKEIYKSIKIFSKKQLNSLIENDSSLKDIIFKGIGVFEEPYTAHYLYQDGIISNNCYIPYYIDTGSGRHKGDFTVVVKPK